MKFNPLLILLFLYPLCLFSQKHSFSGIVKNEYNDFLNGAIIELYEIKNDNATNLLTYQKTDSNGFFEFQNLKESQYYIIVNSFGYQKFKQKIEFQNTNTIDLEIILKEEEKSNHLDELVVISEGVAAKQKGDTISYNLDYFTDGNERSLKDIIEKVPGMEITEEGKIKANGKVIDELLVDGEEFFGKNHKLATENLTADMIGGLDLYHNYTDSSTLSNFDNQSKTALNIKVKEEYKGKLTGNISGYSAYESKYNFSSNLFQFNKKTNISFISKILNTNEEILSPIDYFELIKSDNNSNFDSQQVLDNIPPSFLQNENNHKNTTSFGSLNYSFTPQKKMKISGFSILNYSKIQQLQNISTTFFNIDSYLTLNENKNNILKSILSQNNIKIKYLLNEKSFFDYQIKYLPNQNKDIVTVQQNNLQMDNMFIFDEQKQFNNNHLRQELKYFNRINKNELISFELLSSYSNEKQPYNLKTSENYLLEQNIFDQNFSSKIYNYQTRLKYAIKSKKLLFNTSFAFQNSNKKTSSVLYNFQDISNQLKISINDFEGQFGITKKEGKLNFNLSSTLKYFPSQKIQKQWYILPKIETKYKLKESSVLNFTYYKELNFPDLAYSFYAPIFKNYYTLNQHNEINPFQTMKTDNFMFSFFDFNLATGNSLVFFSRYQLSKNIVTTNNFQELNGETPYTITNYLFSPIKKNIDLNVNYGRKLKFISSILKSQLGYSFSEEINFIQNDKNQLRTKALISSIFLVSKFSESFIGYKLGILYHSTELKNSLNNLTTTNTKIAPLLSIYGKLYNDSIYYKLDNEYSIIRSENLNSNFYKLNIELSYTPVQNWEYYIKGKDILNFTSTNVSSSIQNNVLQETIFSRFPGFIGFGIKYYIK